jgi:hypothetical protein
VNNPLKEDERQPSKKRRNMFSSSISNFFITKEPFQKRQYEVKTKIGRFGVFNFQKPSSFIVCGK